MKKIAIISTGGPALGYGHLMRSKTFLRAAPIEVQTRLFPLVAERDDHIFDSVKDRVTLCRNPEMVVSSITSMDPDIIVWDTVDFQQEAFKQIHQVGECNASISPVFSRMSEMDLLFTRNSSAVPIPGVNTYQGLEYALFNESCVRISDERYQENLKSNHLTVGINMGGADAPNKTLRILKAISDVTAPLTIWVLLGEGYYHSYQHLVHAIHDSENHEIILAKTNRSLWQVMANCSLAILAGGLMTIEALYAGLPSLNVFENPRHKTAAGSEIFDKGAALNLGILGSQALTELYATVQHLDSHRSELLDMRRRASGLVDKEAAKRIYKILLNG